MLSSFNIIFSKCFPTNFLPVHLLLDSDIPLLLEVILWSQQLLLASQDYTQTCYLCKLSSSLCLEFVVLRILRQSFSDFTQLRQNLFSTSHFENVKSHVPSSVLYLSIIFVLKTSSSLMLQTIFTTQTRLLPKTQAELSHNFFLNKNFNSLIPAPITMVFFFTNVILLSKFTSFQTDMHITKGVGETINFVDVFIENSLNLW